MSNRTMALEGIEERADGFLVNIRSLAFAPASHERGPLPREGAFTGARWGLSA
jgi:hypothetical protein